MPRRRIDAQPSLTEPSGGLTNRLAEELKSSKDYGQPLIYEQEYATGKTRVIVIWDEWADASLEERSGIILQAYERAGGRGARDKIALASGLTVPEAAAAGMLPFQVISGRRPSDAVTQEEITEAMVRQGASRLDGKAGLQLRFATEEEAEACRKRLIEDLPASEPIWILHREISSADSFAFADAVGADID
jgi:hypothetical protein